VRMMGSTFMASGSPNLALTSMTRGPREVYMNCPYIVPTYWRPSRRSASTMAWQMATAWS